MIEAFLSEVADAAAQPLDLGRDAGDAPTGFGWQMLPTEGGGDGFYVCALTRNDS